MKLKVVALLLIAVSAIPAFGAGDDSLRPLVEGLKSAEDAKRAESAVGLYRVHQETVTDLVRMIQGQAEPKDFSTGFFAARTLAQWRSRQAGPVLAQHFEWRLSGEAAVRMGARTRWGEYPYAMFLVQIGGKEVRDAVLSRMYDVDEEGLVVLAWILQEVEGEKFAVGGLRSMREEQRSPKMQQIIDRVIDYVGRGPELEKVIPPRGKTEQQ